MNIISKYKRANISDKKVRLVSKLIYNKRVLDALNILTFINKKSARILKKTLKSAIANAKNNYQLNINSLKIKTIFVDRGLIKKKIFFRAKGRTDYIKKRSSNICIIINKI